MTEHPWQIIIGQAPAKSNTYRIVKLGGKPAIKKSDSTEQYERNFYMQVGPYRNMQIKGFFELYVRVYFSTMSHDLDNSLKSILDSLQYAKTIVNDNRCVKIVAEKFIDKTNPRVEFRITEI